MNYIRKEETVGEVPSPSGSCETCSSEPASPLPDIQRVAIEDVERVNGIFLSHSVFRVIMEAEGLAKQVSFRRFPDFLTLHGEIKALFADFKGFAHEALNGRFPGRSYRYDRFNRSFLRARQVQLHEYLGYLCDHPDTRCRQVLSAFLHGRDHVKFNHMAPPVLASHPRSRSLVSWDRRVPSRVMKLRRETNPRPFVRMGTASGVDPDRHYSDVVEACDNALTKLLCKYNGGTNDVVPATLAQESALTDEDKSTKGKEKTGFQASEGSPISIANGERSSRSFLRDGVHRQTVVEFSNQRLV